MSASLDGAFGKLGRADEHLSRLVGEIHRIDQAQPKPSVVHIKIDPPRHVVQVDPIPPLSVEDRSRLALIAGDTVQNLRSSLDYMVCELVRLEGWREPGSQNAFPLFTDDRKFQRRVVKPKDPRRSPLYGLKVNGHAWTFIEGAQPYNTGPEPRYDRLAVLGRLSNQDKHRALYVQMSFPSLDALGDLVDWNPDAILLAHQPILGPLSEEQTTDIAWYEFDPSGPDPGMHVKGRLPVNPTFGDSNEQGGPGMIRDARKRVAEVLNAARTQFSI